MNNYTPSQLKEHLQWLYRQPNYYKEKKTFTHGGKREKILIYKYHEEWAKENGYRENDELNSKNTIGFKDGAER